MLSSPFFIDLCSSLYYNAGKLCYFNVSYSLMKKFNKILNVKVLIFIIILILSGILSYRYIKYRKSTQKRHHILSYETICDHGWVVVLQSHIIVASGSVPRWTFCFLHHQNGKNPKFWGPKNCHNWIYRRKQNMPFCGNICIQSNRVKSFSE